MNRRVTGFVSALIALALSACMLVEDFGSVWEKATPDPCLSKLADSLYYTEFQRDPAGLEMKNIVRGVTLNGSHYLLLKKDADDKGGRMYRFRVSNGIFERYRLVPTKRAEFERDYPQAPVSLARDTITLTSLEKPEQQLLADIAAKDDYWEVEEKLLYNTLRNPACRFDDRDLTKPEFTSRKKNVQN